MPCSNITNNSNFDLDKHQPMFDSFFPYSQKVLGYDKPFSLRFTSDQENSENPLGKTAYYDPSNSEITIFVDNRHTKDIMRSISHELVHHAQNCRGEFDKGISTGDGYAQEDGHLRGMEREAYEKGNLCFRDWEDQYKRLRENKMADLAKQEIKELLSEFRTDMMASPSEYSKLRKNLQLTGKQKAAFSKWLDSWTANEVGHLTLDILGLFPMIGNAADIINAIWYLNDKELEGKEVFGANARYVYAGLSLVSGLPILGQAVSTVVKPMLKAGGKVNSKALVKFSLIWNSSKAARKGVYKKVEDYFTKLSKYPVFGSKAKEIFEAVSTVFSRLGKAKNIPTPPVIPGLSGTNPLIKKANKELAKGKPGESFFSMLSILSGNPIGIIRKGWNAAKKSRAVKKASDFAEILKNNKKAAEIATDLQKAIKNGDSLMATGMERWLVKSMVNSGYSIKAIKEVLAKAGSKADLMQLIQAYKQLLVVSKPGVIMNKGRILKHIKALENEIGMVFALGDEAIAAVKAGGKGLNRVRTAKAGAGVTRRFTKGEAALDRLNKGIKNVPKNVAKGLKKPIIRKPATRITKAVAAATAEKEVLGKEGDDCFYSDQCEEGLACAKSGTPGKRRRGKCLSTNLMKGAYSPSKGKDPQPSKAPNSSSSIAAKVKSAGGHQKVYNKLGRYPWQAAVKKLQDKNMEFEKAVETVYGFKLKGTSGGQTDQRPLINALRRKNIQLEECTISEALENYKEKVLAERLEKLTKGLV